MDKTFTMYVLRRHLSREICSIVANMSEYLVLGGYNVRSHLHCRQIPQQPIRPLSKETQGHFICKEFLLALCLVTQIVQCPSKHSSLRFFRFFSYRRCSS